RRADGRGRGWLTRDPFVVSGCRSMSGVALPAGQRAVRHRWGTRISPFRRGRLLLTCVSDTCRIVGEPGMVQSFSLSLAAIDILFEHLRLGHAPFPFEVPHLGQTFTERSQIRQAVFRDLESRDLMRGGRVDADVEAALVTFARGPVAITAAAKLEKGEKLFARSAVDGQLAVLAKRDGNLIVFNEIRPVGLVPEIVNLIPSTRPAPGQSVTVAQPQPQQDRGRHAAPDSYDPFAGVSAPTSRRDPQLR